MMLGAKTRRRRSDEHSTIIQEDSVSAPGIANRPQRQCCQIRRVADGGPGEIVSLCNVSGTEFSSEIDKQLPIRGDVALIRVDPSPKPLPFLKAVPPRVPQRDSPPL